MMYGLDVIADSVYGEEFHRLSPSTKGSAAIDLRAKDDITIYPDHRKMIDTGLAIHIKNPLIAGLVLPRSGLGSLGITLSNAIGLIDSDYQGNIHVNMHNGSNQIQEFRRGDRIAQLLLVHIMPPVMTRFNSVEAFSERTERGEGGFGSTGIR